MRDLVSGQDVPYLTQKGCHIRGAVGVSYLPAFAMCRKKTLAGFCYSFLSWLDTLGSRVRGHVHLVTSVEGAADMFESLLLRGIPLSEMCQSLSNNK